MYMKAIRQIFSTLLVMLSILFYLGAGVGSSYGFAKAVNENAAAASSDPSCAISIENSAEEIPMVCPQPIRQAVLFEFETIPRMACKYYNLLHFPVWSPPDVA